MYIGEKDKGWKKLLRYEIPSSLATGDWLRRMRDSPKGAEGLEGLERVEITQMHRVMRRELFSKYTLDLDATATCANKQEANMTTKVLRDICL